MGHIQEIKLPIPSLFLIYCINQCYQHFRKALLLDQYYLETHLCLVVNLAVARVRLSRMELPQE